MPRKVFQASKYKDEIMQKLRDGELPEKLANDYPISERTIFRYLKEVQDEKKGVVQPKTRAQLASVVAPGVAKEAFTPSGAPVAVLPQSVASQEFLTLGTFRMPLEDWGYSSALNLLIVAETYTHAREEYGLPKTVKVGDFVAQLCQAFRMMKGWDVVGIGYKNKEDGNGNRAGS